MRVRGPKDLVVNQEIADALGGHAVQATPHLVVEANMVNEFEHSKFAADMSDIGLTVKVLMEVYGGNYPEVLETRMSNGLPFVLRSVDRDDEGDCTCIHYHQANGCITLTLWND